MDAGQKAGGENGEAWRKMKRKGGTVNIVRVCVKASPAEGRRRLHTNTTYARLSGFGFRSFGLQVFRV